MADRYARIIHAAMTTPWAITPEKAMIIRDLLQFRAAGGRLTAEEVRARVGAVMDDEKPKPRQSGLVAVIPVWGVIAHRTCDASSGMTSTEMISAWLRKAVNDEEVSAIILDISSPGGMVDGTPELAAEVFAAPISAGGKRRGGAKAEGVRTTPMVLKITPATDATVPPSNYVIDETHVHVEGDKARQALKRMGDAAQPTTTAAASPEEAPTADSPAETIEKFKKRRNVWKGRKHSDASKARMSETQRRAWEAHPEWKASSEAVKAGRISAALKATGRKRSPSAVERTAKACMKPIIDQHGTIYPSRSAAAATLGIDISNISAVVNGRRPHVRRFVFRNYQPPMEIAS